MRASFVVRSWGKGMVALGFRGTCDQTVDAMFGPGFSTCFVGVGWN